MSAQPKSIATPGSAPAEPDLALLDLSARLPFLALLVPGAVWLLVSSGLGLLASLKFHAPSMLADCAWLTYGRIYPASQNALVYGFCIPASLAVMLWLFARLGRTPVSNGWLAILGASLWHLGVLLGLGGILAGDSTGFPNLEMPGYATLLLFGGYLLIGLVAAATFHQRTEPSLYISQWFLLAALFWFPWIYATAELLLVVSPVRGVAQSVIAWWFTANLQTVWMWLTGVALLFYFVPKLTGRALASRHMALFIFWTLLLFGSWTGIPTNAPLPSWLPVLSTIMTVLSALSIAALIINLHRTVLGSWGSIFQPELGRFFGVSFVALLLAATMSLLCAFPTIGNTLNLTWFTPAKSILNNYGFLCLALFGALYYILPRVIGAPLSRGLVTAHFWVAVIGVFVLALSLAGAGVMQGLQLRQPHVPFTTIIKSTMMPFRLSTLGDVLLLLGHLLFFINVLGLLSRLYRPRALAAYSDATADLFKTREARI